MKTLINSIIAIIILYCGTTFCQTAKELKIDLLPTQINGDAFDGRLYLSINNMSKDTLLFVIEPFNCKLVEENGLNFVQISKTHYNPNRIVFVKSGIELSEIDGASSITFLQFPKILILFPNKKCAVDINVDKQTLSILAGSNWTIIKEIWYAPYNNIRALIEKKPTSIYNEFKESLIVDDRVNIELTSRLDLNSSIYFYNSSNSSKEQDKCTSVYDSLINNCFYYYAY